MRAMLQEPVGVSRDSADFQSTALPHLPAIARLARALVRQSSDADDLVQETFLRAFRYWPTFETGTDCFRWLAAICRNVAHDHFRRVAADESEPFEETDDWSAARAHAAARDAGFERLFDRIDLGPAIQRAIDSLPPAFREVVVLSDVEGLSYEHIALNLDIPVGTVRSRLYRARRLLQQQLHDYAVDAGFGTSSRKPTAA